jgi:hypothetical protein
MWVVKINCGAKGRVVVGHQRRQACDLIGVLHVAPVPLDLLQGDHIRA